MTEPASRYRSRALVLTGCLLLLLGAIVVRLGYLQILRHDELSRLAERQYSKTIPLRPERGPILDRNGYALAVSAAVESVYALPARISDRAAVAAALAPLLDERPRDVQQRLTSDRPFVWVKVKIPPPAGEAIRALRLPGIGTVPETLRFYPSRDLAAHVLGFVGRDDRGLEGVELAHDKTLAGEAGLALVERDALGREVTGQPTILKTPTPGTGLVLTLDATVQYLAERELDAAWRATGAKGGMILAMDPRTGEILAMAMRPTFNPNTYHLSTAEQWRNRAVTDPFEPGSTFKAILAAAALEEGVARPGDRIYGEQGFITIASKTIHDWKKYGWLTFQQVLQLSSNVGAIKVGLQLGRERYYRHITGFGFGSLTGVGLPGESRGQLRPPARWSGLSLASISIGQEVSVTGVQLLAAFGVIANGGRLMQPHVVRALLDRNGREVRRTEPQVLRQVVSPETAATLTDILTSVVADGTGHKAAVQGYGVAGKTGTAQKPDPVTHVYSRKPGVLSFVGFVPSNAPRLVILALLDEPKTVVWGSEAAAPIFAAVAASALRHLDVPPTDTVPPIQIVRATGRDAEREPPAEPEAGLPPDGDAVMPDLGGKSLRQALALLGALDVDVAVAGRGIVVRQTPAPGTPLSPGASCRLELAPPAAVPAGLLMNRQTATGRHGPPQAATGRRPSEEGRPTKPSEESRPTRSVPLPLAELG
jgi:cell division protein FtsI (penicillin-binding protein 3)